MVVIEYLKAGGISSAYENSAAGLKALGVGVVRNSVYSDFDILDAYTVDPLSFMLIMKNKRVKPVVMHANIFCGDFIGTFNQFEKLGLLLNQYLAKFYRQADAIITPTKFSRGMLLELVGKLNAPIEVISNGIDTEKFRHDPARRRSFRSRLGISENRVVVYGVGHLFMRKGIVTFSNLARRFKECEFVWVGPKYSGALMADQDELTRIQKNAPKNLHFPGYVKDVRDVHCGGDIFLFPSYYENEGIAALEAASSGRPLVLRDLQVYDGRFKNGHECFRCSTDEEFERALGKLVSSERLRRSMGAAAREAALKMDIKTVAKKTLSVYESAIGLKRRRRGA